MCFNKIFVGFYYRATSAMDMFNRMDRSRQDSSSTQSSTIHQNSIKQINIYKQERGRVSHVTTCGLDGNVVLWDLKSLEGQFSNLRIN